MKNCLGYCAAPCKISAQSDLISGNDSQNRLAGKKSSFSAQFLTLHNLDQKNMLFWTPFLKHFCYLPFYHLILFQRLHLDRQIITMYGNQRVSCTIMFCTNSFSFLAEFAQLSHSFWVNIVAQISWYLENVFGYWITNIHTISQVQTSRVKDKLS